MLKTKTRAAFMCTVALPLIFLGCVSEVDKSAQVDSETSKVEALSQQDVGEQPVLQRDENIYVDPKTGIKYIRSQDGKESYVLNPNWSKLTAQGDLPSGLTAKVAATLGQWTDITGQVEITIYYSVLNSSWDASLECNKADGSTQVEEDRVLVGGGAWADYGGGAGAFVTQSFPDGATHWAAQSKDHGPYNPHTLYIYAVGLRLKDNSGNWIAKSTVLGLMNYTSVETSSNTTNSQGVPMNSGYWMVGGGAKVQWSTKAQLLTESRPWEGQHGWYAASKSHKTTESCKLRVYAIGITKSAISNFGQIEVRTPVFSQNYSKSLGSFASSGALTDNITASTAPAFGGYVPTCIGTKSESLNGRGRLITRMSYGINGSGLVVGTSGTKDHFVNESGDTYTYFYEIKKQ